jgi:hypothetical protein
MAKMKHSKQLPEGETEPKTLDFPHEKRVSAKNTQLVFAACQLRKSPAVLIFKSMVP